MTRNVSDDAANPNKTTMVGADKFMIIDTETEPDSLKEITKTNVFTSPTIITPTLVEPVLTSPTIGDFTNAAHDHGDADDGGAVVNAALPATIDGKTFTNATLTTPTVASLTNMQHTHQNAAGGGTLTSAALATSPYVLVAQCAAFNPADATTYFLGSQYINSPTATAQRRKIFIPRTGTVKRVDMFIVCVTGTSEASTISFRLNDTTDTALTTAVDLSASPFEALVTGLSIAVTAGGYFELKWVTPTWVTNPTTVSLYASVYIE